MDINFCWMSTYFVLQPLGFSQYESDGKTGEDSSHESVMDMYLMC